jgi:hypothetical protein
MRPTAHEIYGRRRSRNLGLGLSLAAFVTLVFMVTIVKLNAGHNVRGFQLSGSDTPTLDASHIPSAAERAAARASERSAGGN